MFTGKITTLTVARIKLFTFFVVPSLSFGACHENLDPLPASQVPSATTFTVPSTHAFRGQDTEVLKSVPYDTVPGSYIVVFRRELTKNAAGVHAATDALIKRFGGELTFRYDSAIHGFAVTGLNNAIAEQIAKDPVVAYVEPDMVIYPANTQINPSWALDRIDQRDLPLNSAYNFTRTGAGVHVYIIDTGINAGLPEFGGRVLAGKTCVGTNPNTDFGGHGTKVAAIAAGSTAGVARGAWIHSVRISNTYNSSTTSSLVQCGVNWVASFGIKPAVVNLSFSAIPNTFSLRDAINNVTGAGMVFVKAAGNDALDAFLDRANRAPDAIIVGAANQSDQRALFSNWGPTVQMHAPGVNIPTVNMSGNSDLLSGTSAAAPLVTGAAATYLETNPSASQSVVRGTLFSVATLDRLLGLLLGTPNVLLFSDFML